jgi:hypothetical protein
MSLAYSLNVLIDLQLEVLKACPRNHTLSFSMDEGRKRSAIQQEALIVPAGLKSYSSVELPCSCRIYVAQERS